MNKKTIALFIVTCCLIISMSSCFANPELSNQKDESSIEIIEEQYKLSYGFIVSYVDEGNYTIISKKINNLLSLGDICLS